MLLVSSSLFAAVGHARAQRPAGDGPSACARVSGPLDSSAAGRLPVTADAPVRADTLHTTLRIIAAVHADEVRFVGSPKICVTLNGDAQLDSVRVTARRNITSPVVSGTTYRNVYVAAEILGRLNSDCIAVRITRTRADSAGVNPAACAQLELQTGRGAGGKSP